MDQLKFVVFLSPALFSVNGIEIVMHDWFIKTLIVKQMNWINSLINTYSRSCLLVQRVEQFLS